MKKKWFYKGDLLRNYLKNNINNKDNLEYLFYYVTNLIKKEDINNNADDVISNILNREDVKEIMDNPLKRETRKSWNYKGEPLKEYLKKFVEEDLNFLYLKIRRILDKEYNEDTNLDQLIEDILNRNDIKAIIDKKYIKQEKSDWKYKNILLKDYLRTLVDEEQLDFLYKNICINLRNEYKDGMDLDQLIEDILQRKKFVDIIDGSYIKRVEKKWYYKGVPLIEYVNQNIKSDYRTSIEITEMIRNYVDQRIKNNNLDSSYREQLIEKYINSNLFKKTIAKEKLERKEYYYKEIKLKKYISDNIKNIDNLEYVYRYILNKLNDNNDIDNLMNSEEIASLLNLDYIQKIEREHWFYKNGLLIDYLKSIDLYNKNLSSVYIQVKYYINNKYIDGFNSIDEKTRAIEEYIDSEEFQNYLKFGYTNRAIYFYKNMLLIDYIRLNYKEKLEETNRKDDNIYHKIIHYLKKEYDLDSLTIEQRELLIDHYINSMEFNLYLNSKKYNIEKWDYLGISLKELVLQYYDDIIEDETDLNRIYRVYVSKAHKIKNNNKNILNYEIIDLLLADEIVNKTKEEYIKRKQRIKDIQLKQELYKNKNDLSYIFIYCKDNNIDFNKFIEVNKQISDNYSSIMLIEYSNKYNENLEYLIKYTNSIKTKEHLEDSEYLWLYKLGNKEYIYNVIKNNKRKINKIIYKQMYLKLNNNINIDSEEIYSNLIELLLKKHIIFTSKKEYLINSFMSFVKSFLNRYFLELSHSILTVTLDDVKYKIISTNEKLENSIIDNDVRNIVVEQISNLADIEQEFINLRYGFIDKVYNLFEIKQIFDEKNITFTIEELQQLESDILRKLGENPKILSLKKK